MLAVGKKLADNTKFTVCQDHFDMVNDIRKHRAHDGRPVLHEKVIPHLKMTDEEMYSVVERVWIKNEPVETETTQSSTCFHISCEEGESIVKIDSSATDPFKIETITPDDPFTIDSVIPDCVIIKTEVTEGDYECAAAPEIIDTYPETTEYSEPRAKKKYNCDECGQVIASKASYEAHQRKHSGERPFPCNLCPKRFFRKEILDKHLRLHTGIKPYSCDICGMRFAQNGHVKPHRQTHDSSEKPFACDICPSKFSRNSALKIHKMKHTGETRFACDTCGKGFTRKEYLVKHERVHTGEKPFNCEECGKKYSQKAHLDSHRYKNH